MKKTFALCLALCVLMLTTACDMIVKTNDDEQYDYPVTVGNCIFETAPQKVAVLSENLADIVLACGYEGKLVMISDECTQEDLQILPSAGTPDQPSVSALTNAGVDLVLADKSLSGSTKSTLIDSGAQVLVIKPASSDDELEKIYSNIASILGGNYSGKMKAMSTVDSLKSSLNKIKNSIVDTNVLATSCYIYDVDGDQCVVAHGNDFTAEIFDYAQVTNIVADDDDGLVGNDTLLRSNPETIFCDVGVYEKLTSNKDLKSLKAIAASKVYTLPSEYLTLQGKTLVSTVDFIAAKTHSLYQSTAAWPESFTDNKTEYVPPFTPEEGIFYTVGESYKPIKYIEERLIGLGYMNGSADENYTDDTAYAVSYFQSKNGIEPTGVADYNTLKVLMSSDAIAADEGVQGDEVTIEY